MRMGKRIVEGSINRYRMMAVITATVTLIIAALAALPSLLPDGLGPLHTITVDTDPENMLPADEPVRVYHDRMKERLNLHDMVVVGVVNTDHPQGVFNPDSLARVHELTEYAKTLTGPAIGREPGEGVISAEIIAPSTVDNIIPGEATISFSWMMPSPPVSPQAAQDILRDARRIPFLEGTMVPEPGRGDEALAIYLPITSKDISYPVYSKLREKVATFEGSDQYHITGLPVAEDTFGVEMFIQMAISAPAAMAVIFVLMLLFFRKLIVVVSPMIVAMVSVIVTMGALIIAGFPIHIMSSMIPIFIMPIAVLDSIHIISEFFEKYQATHDRRATLLAVMDDLFMPMLYTSLTSAAGFASLALTPIPPVQTFGLFVGMGIMVAWVLTVTFIPAFVMFIPPRMLEGFGARHVAGEHAHDTALTRSLRWIGRATFRYAKPIIAAAAVVLVVAGWGISKININDNPIKWFSSSHPIRQADRIMNGYLGGTYMAYLAVEYEPDAFEPAAYAQRLGEAADARADAISDVVNRIPDLAGEIAAESNTLEEFYDNLEQRLRPDPDAATDEAQAAFSAVKGFLDASWDPFAESPADFDVAVYASELYTRAMQFADAARASLTALGESAVATAGDGSFDTRDALLDALATALPADAHAAVRQILAEQRQTGEVFKRPEVLEYLQQVQTELDALDVVGKSNSLVQIVTTINRDLHGGREDYAAVPASVGGVAQAITQFESGHRPGDLYHFVTPNYQAASIWVQLRSGDNQDMRRVVRHMNAFFERTHAPVSLRPEWFGLTYINVVWQEKMVGGMLKAFGGSFLVVFVLMTILFRSPLWGLLSMIPLTVTIAAIYGAIGIIGKDYDMPVAVLSSLTLGLAVDFAIHFLARSRTMYAATGSWQATAPNVFGEPARAITRNIIVIAAGFTPLLLAPLVPYKTVGALLATILLVSGVATLLLIPAMMRMLERRLFAHYHDERGVACNCAACVVTATAVAAAIVLNVQPYVPWHWSTLTWIALAVVPVAAAACSLLARRRRCNLQEIEEQRK